MNRLIFTTIVLLAAAHFVGLPLQSLLVWVVAIFLLVLGWRWLITSKLPQGAGRAFLLLLLGAPVLVMLLNVAFNELRQADARVGPLVILIGVLLAGWLVPKVWRKKKLTR